MQLVARLYPPDEKSLTILRRYLPAKNIKPVSGRYPAALDNPVLSDILAKGEKTCGFRVSAEAVFSREEISGVTHFEIVCRKFISESDKDYEHNFAACERSELLERGGASPIRLVTGFALSRITLKPNMVGAIDQWTSEYIIGKAVRDVFKKEGFTGWSVQPVLNLKSKSFYSDYVQLVSNCILKPAVVDDSVERLSSPHPEEDGHWRHLGCLCYRKEDMEGLTDFTRTAEPWAGWHGFPSWVVSSRVVEVFAQNKLRGWAFRPVLTAESDLYRQYRTQWQVLCQLLKKYPRSIFDGGRW